MGTLYEYLKNQPTGSEVIVIDDVYDIEVYFYNDDATDDVWQACMLELAKMLKISKVFKRGKYEVVSVGMSSLIDSKLEALKESRLFYRCYLEEIMADIHSIIAGYVSEDWFTSFVSALK